jgi:hypothetical protein
MSEAKAKKKLEEISVKWNGKVTADQILKVFKNVDNKYNNEKLSGIAKQYIRVHLADGEKLFMQYEMNVKKNQKTPYEALILMLNNASSQIQKPQVPVKPTNLNLHLDSKISVRSDFESPALSSTRVDNNNHTPDIVVSEVIAINIILFT